MIATLGDQVYTIGRNCSGNTKADQLILLKIKNQKFTLKLN